jgi:hypothetical protein
LAFLIYCIDFNHPYAIDVNNVFARWNALRRHTTEWSPAQKREVAFDWGSIMMDEAFQMHEEALATCNWDTIYFTFRQLRQVWQVFDDRVFNKAYKRIKGPLHEKRKAGKLAKGAKREKGHDWDTICSHYDKLMSEGQKRATVTTILWQRYDITKNDLNRGLRQRGRGSNTKK